MPSRKTITEREIPKLEKEVRDVLQIELDSAKWVSLTTDMWSSCTNTPFMDITAHFLSHDLNLQSCLLACKRFHNEHSGENICKEMDQILRSFGLRGKEVSCTTDNAKNEIKAIKELNVPRIPCLAHTLNLCAQDALKSNQSLCDLRQRLNEIVTFTRQSHLGKEELQRVQLQLNIQPPKVLLSEVRTRWNSTFLMMERFLELREAITLFLAKDSVKLDLLNNSVISKKNSLT